MKTGMALNIHFVPLVPLEWLFVLGPLALFILVLSLAKNRTGVALRTLTCAFFILALLNPSLLREQREVTRDVAVIVVDKSQSQKMGSRETRTQQALEYLQNTLSTLPGLETRTVEAPSTNILTGETRLFSALEQALADVPEERRAGAIFITDGQVHDVPQNLQTMPQTGPLHILLSGDKNEKDRQVTLLQAPAYGITGQSVTIRYKIEDTGSVHDPLAGVTLNHPGGKPETFFVTVGEEQTLELPVAHAGENVFELSTQVIPGELTPANNRVALIVNGVRDRLRVLLVSGQPYAGGRTWRDLLTSDPGVDLVHFTILREPEKIDFTPQNELSLIAFPFHELFEVKLYDFDLIIFDRYHLNRILPEDYFDNIVRYVEEGGALLESSGPSFAGENSLYTTNLRKILPAAPVGSIIEKPYLPVLTKAGFRHPVTRGLTQSATQEKPGWGHWLRQVVLQNPAGETLMDGADGNPLLILNRVKEGRVAQIASDQIWLWSRGYDGGGPHAELLRRIVHWLMKEPALDEKIFSIKVDGTRITISSQDYTQSGMVLTMTKPDGRNEPVTLTRNTDGLLESTIDADQLGIYIFEGSDGQRRLITVGALSPPELRSIKTTPELLAPAVKKSGGGILWLTDTANPAIRTIAATNRTFTGDGWLALRRNGDYTVTGVQDSPLLPPEIMAVILLSLLILCWWREGHNR